jgi:hypothetical protein
MSRSRRHAPRPGDLFRCPDTGETVRIDEKWRRGALGARTVRHVPARARARPPRRHPAPRDGSVSPFHDLSHDQLERLGEDTPRADARRARHDGWTPERQKMFIETLAATASISEACRYVGLSRQSAHKLYGRSPHFRAAWDEALKAAVGVLAATAFDRAVNGTQEQVWHDGQMIGFREKHHDRLLMYLLRVRDPLNYAPLDDLQGWARHRAIEGKRDGLEPVLDRLEAAERAWATAAAPAELPAPADCLAPMAASACPERPSTPSTMSTSPGDEPASAEEGGMA